MRDKTREVSTIQAARVEKSADLARVMDNSNIGGDRVLIKVNWFGPEYGYFTDARTLDLVLGALKQREKIIIEGHAYGRNDGTRDLSWRDPDQVEKARSWIQDQEGWFLDSTGLAGVLEKHGASYINVTDEVWANRTVEPSEVRAVVEGVYTPVAQGELYSYVPSKLWELRGSTLLSLSRMKLRSSNALAEDQSPFSPIFSLSMKNLFGLIPDPFRFAWHGSGGEKLAQSILDVNKIYGALFDVVGINEGIFHLLINDPIGVHETNWGNYDILEDAGLALVGRNLIALDTFTASLFFSTDWSRWPFFALAERDFGPVDSALYPPVPSAFSELIEECRRRYRYQTQPAPDM